jgi:hypothetical protein
MKARHASINDLAIAAADRLFHWPQGRRPDDHPSLSDLGSRYSARQRCALCPNKSPRAI